ncbi:MAG: NAD(P)H-binding protein [Cyanobacteria bacterium SID2]|nr:NAD(P)H-binding protein [Cyanobacteria bacterium SID2]MBP0004194.1 NAD(P)H-binding protein [Cyanobacteria bacterium SBC]
MINTNENASNLTLVLGGTGKTGRRVVERLEARGVLVRVGSRSAEVPFEWQDPATWTPVLQDVASVYITYYPDLAVPGATDTIRSFVEQAVQSGVRHLVLLSGRGEEEAQRCECIVREAGVDWTILRASWFSQNFSEAFLRDLVLGGVVALPAGEVQEPFISADDIADVAVTVLTEPGHEGELYELTGPRLMSFAEAVGEIAKATGRDVSYVPISLEAFVSALIEQGVPTDFVSLLSYLFDKVLDGHNAYLTDGVQRVLGRAPRDFTVYAQATATSGAWKE